MPAEEVISCPACRHLVRVPEDWLGTQVQCPQCRAMFQAPVRQPDGSLSASRLLSDPTPRVSPLAPRRPGWLLMLPAFGLMLCGVLGAAVDGMQCLQFQQDPQAAKQRLKESFKQMRAAGFQITPETDPKKQDQAEDDAAEQNVPIITNVLAAFALVSVVVFLGGLAIVTRRAYPMALIGCLAAMVNIGNLCCVPGVVFGLWGLILLILPEGRAHFRG